MMQTSRRRQRPIRPRARADCGPSLHLWSRFVTEQVVSGVSAKYLDRPSPTGPNVTNRAESGATA